MLVQCPIGKVFITAFQSFDEFRKYLKKIAWETEVWIIIVAGKFGERWQELCYNLFARSLNTET